MILSPVAPAQGSTVLFLDGTVGGGDLVETGYVVDTRHACLPPASTRVVEVMEAQSLAKGVEGHPAGPIA